MTKQQLEYFLSATEFRNLSKAAAYHYVSVPTLARNITALENEFNTKLFERNNKGLSLTASGVMFLPKARDMLLQIYDYQASLVSKDLLISSPADEFTIGYNAYGGLFPELAQLVNRYFVDWIGKPCRLRCVKDGTMVNTVKTRAVSAGTLTGFTLDQYPDTFESHSFLHSELQLLVNPDSPLAKRDSIDFTELRSDYPEFENYLPPMSDLALKYSGRRIHSVNDLWELIRCNFELMPRLEQTFIEYPSRFRYDWMVISPRKIQRPEYADLVPLEITGQKVSVDFRIFWLKNNQSEDIAKLKQALEFARIH